MKTLLLSTDDIQNFSKLIYDPKVAHLSSSTNADATNLMALQHYLKYPAAIASTAPTSSTTTTHVHGQQQLVQRSQILSYPTAVRSIVINSGNSSSSNNITSSHAHHAQLLVQSQTQLKQLQLKQPTIHQNHQHAASFHHPYYQTQHSITTTAAPAPAHTNSSSQHHHHHHSHNSNSHSAAAAYNHHSSAVPVHAHNQNSNFSAASSSTGGGTASSHAPTQQSNTTGSSLSPPGASASARTTPASGTASNGAANANASASSRSSANGSSSAKKLKTEPVLSQFHQNERLSFANAHVNWSEDHWKRVVFQDERKFNLDGPDGFSYYFHDLRNYERTLSQRPRGNSVYIYLVVTAGGPICLEVSTAKLKTETWAETIIRERANIVAKLGGNSDFHLQDYNWTANALPTTQEWLSAQSLKTQKWPTIAHDLNIMEGIWGWLIREVFDGGRKFSRKDDLIFRIHEAWSRLPMELITNLFTTLPERLTQLYYTRGAYTNC